jgi:hypothetical protein
MKRINNNKYKKTVIAISCLTVLVFGSCKKFLDVQPISGLAPSTLFGSVPLAKTAVTGIYQDLTGNYGYGAILSIYFPYDNDEMMGPTAVSDGGKVDDSHYNVTSTTQAPYFTYAYNQLYEGIERANNCIKYIPLMSDYNSAGDSSQLHRMYGEALTLRAQFYFDLVKLWGDVPAQWVPSADQTNLFLPQTSRDTIYDHILNDLQIAAPLMPWSWQLTAPDGRLTQNAARALRARIALFAGGWSLRQNGQMQRRSDFKNYYQIALNECQAVILNGQNNLNPSFQAIFQNGLCLGVSEPKEVLFQIGAVSGAGVNGDLVLGIYDGPKSSISGFHGSGGILVLPNYFYLFDSTDSRRDVTCAPFKVGATSIAGSNSIASVYDGKFRRNWANGGQSATNNPNYLEENWPLIRYSDVLLMDAEADNEINQGPSAQALQYFNTVRQRAYGTKPIGTTPTDYVGFFNAIMKERSLEFGGEGLRKYDLIRWDSLASRIAETKTILLSMDSASTGNPNYSTYMYNGYTVSQLPTSIYYNGVNASGNLNWVTSLYAHTQPQPAGSTKNGWLGSSIATLANFFATGAVPPPGGFVADKSQLLPFPLTALSTDPNMNQNFGYH